LKTIDFKNSKKFIEKGIHGIITKSQNLKKSISKDSSINSEETLENCIDKLKSLKQKYYALLKAEDNLLEICHKRISHISEYQSRYKESNEILENYHLTRLDRLFLDYFLREGYFETAQNFTSFMELENYSDMDIFTESKTIMASLVAHNLDPAIKWCVTHKTRLANMKSTLEMHLRIQEFIELIKNEKFSDAILYSRKNFKKYMEEAPELMQKVMTLIAIYTPFIKDNKEIYDLYKDLMSEERWGFLAGMFMQESYRLYSLTSESLLSLTLQNGLSSLKTQFCEDPTCKNEKCPTCSHLLGELAKLLPYSYHLHTSVVCKITGEIMNENNPPMALPNGYVYSEKVFFLPRIMPKNRVCK